MGISTKFHHSVTTDGLVVEGFLNGGNVNDVVAAPALVEDVIGCYIAADQGYDSDDFWRGLAARNNIAGKPGRKNRRKPVE